MSRFESSYELLVPGQLPDAWRGRLPSPTSAEDTFWPQFNFLTDRSPNELAVIHANYTDLRKEWTEIIAPAVSVGKAGNTSWGDPAFMRASLSNPTTAQENLSLTWNGNYPQKIEETLSRYHDEEPEAITALGTIIGETIFGERARKLSPSTQDSLAISFDTYINFDDRGSTVSYPGINPHPPNCRIFFPDLFSRHTYAFEPLRNRFEAVLINRPDGVGAISREEFSMVASGLMHLINTSLDND